jgi:hypothetical protein
MKTRYEADDGTMFDTVEAAREHEKQTEFSILEGLTDDELESAISDPLGELATVIEKFARRVAKARIAAGGAMRVRVRKAPAEEKGEAK